MQKSIWSVVGCLVGLCCFSLPASAAVVDSINETKAPIAGSWNASEVGWLYTPGFSYDLTGVETKFFSVDGRSVDLEVYDEHPLLGGMLLGSASFTASTSFAGGTFPTVSLVGGEDYFIGFRNVLNLGFNTTADAGATSLGFLFFNPNNEGTYPNGEQGAHSQPILRFIGERIGEPSPVPEPASMALLGMGALPLLRRLRRKSAPVAETV